MRGPERLLLLQDKPADATAIVDELRREFPSLRVQSVFGYDAFADALGHAAFDLVITDFELGWTDGLTLLHAIRAHWPHCPVIMFSGAGSEEIAVAAMKAGVTDYIPKSPVNLPRLRAAVRVAWEQASGSDRFPNPEVPARPSTSQFSLLYETTRDLSSQLDLPTLLQTITERSVMLLAAFAGGIYLYDPARNDLEHVASVGHLLPLGMRLQLGQGVAGRVAETRQPLIVNNYQTWEHRAPQYAAIPFAGVVGVPMLYRGDLIGVLTVALSGTDERRLTDTDARFLTLFAGQAASAVYNANLFNHLQRSSEDLAVAYDATIEGWSRALDLRDHETEGHSQRVTEMTERLACALGMSEEERLHVRRGALLHDIGKMGIPDSILLKPGPLTDDEWGIMRQHPTYAYELLEPIAFLRPALDIPYSHHEKWDGTGYPRGLKGEQIPLAARLFALVDVWDALCSDRPYRPAWPYEKVCDHLRQQAGLHFDPNLLELFLQLQEASMVIAGDAATDAPSFWAHPIPLKRTA